MPASDLPIGVFDSGVGGLTVLDALRRHLPAEDLIYLGDTARVPYGTRAPETVRRYSARIASHLVQRGIKALVVACNTATAHALTPLQAAGARVGLPVLGVIEPGVDAGVRVTRVGHVAVIGTEGTVKGGRYQALLAARGVACTALACPLFVALAEEGWTDDEVARLVARRYLDPLNACGADTLILGCTHYPLLRRAISAAVPALRIVDSAEATALSVAGLLRAAGLLREGGLGEVCFLVTDNLERFVSVGERFLGERPRAVELVDIHEASSPFTLEDLP